jgi:predicted RNA-binding Zn-ribbon protein involved in translation (DUF1610 family)
MRTFAARRVDRDVERPERTFMSWEQPPFVGGQLNVGRGDLTVTCPNCKAVLLDSVKIARFLGMVFVCPTCKTHCDPSPAAGISSLG